MVDEFAEHQEVGEMELAAADGHRTAGLGLHPKNKENLTRSVKQGSKS